MKINARYLKRLFNDKHESEVTFLVSNYQHQRYINDLSNEKEYTIEIKLVKQKRSRQQNKMLWSLIRALALATREDDLDIYIKLLDSTNAKFDYVWGKVEVEDSLKQSFRVVKRVKAHKIAESDGWLYKCYSGSSKYTVEEMNHLLDTLLRWCIEEGIDTEEHKYEE